MNQQAKRVLIGMVLLFGLYASVYGIARNQHILVMWAGYRGYHGVQGADLGGPQAPTAIMLVRSCELAFLPLCWLETQMRSSSNAPPRTTGRTSNKATTAETSSSLQPR